MKHCKKRVSKIVDELLTCFMNLHATNIKIELEELEACYMISIKGNCKDLTEEMAERFIRLLNTPMHQELEEYYWELTGEGDVDNELALVGMMTSRAAVNFLPNEYLEIQLYRDK